MYFLMLKFVLVTEPMEMCLVYWMLNGNVVTGLDYYTVQGSYGIMKDKDGKIVPNYNGKVPLMINDLPNPTMRWEKIVHIRDRFRYWFSE